MTCCFPLLFSDAAMQKNFLFGLPKNFSSVLNTFIVTQGFCPWHFGTLPSVHMSVFVRNFRKFLWYIFLRDYTREHLNHRNGEKLVHIRQFFPSEHLHTIGKKSWKKNKKILVCRNLPWSFTGWLATILISFDQKCLVMCRVLFWFWEFEWVWLLCVLIASKRR